MKTNLEIIADLKKENEEYKKLDVRGNKKIDKLVVIESIKEQKKIRKSMEHMAHIAITNFETIEINNEFKEFMKLNLESFVFGLVNTKWELYQLALKCEKEAEGDLLEYTNCDLFEYEDWKQASTMHGVKFYEYCIKEYVKHYGGLHIWLEEMNELENIAAEGAYLIAKRELKKIMLFIAKCAHELEMEIEGE